MKTIGAIITGTVILATTLGLSANVSTQAGKSEGAVKEDKAAGTSSRATPLRPRMSVARTADFYLRTGEFIFGRLVTEDKNKITVERLEGGKIIPSTYSRREIEPRTLQTKSIPEYRYYLDLAEHFSSRTWDFKDDPDDFIQAIRCCEKAKRSVLPTQTQGSERIAEIDERIKKLQADRQVWERETESRAKLKTLEFEAEMETRLKELAGKIDAVGPQIEQAMEQLDNAVTEMKDSHLRLEQGVAAVDQDIFRRLNILADQVEATRRLIDPVPRYYYPYRGYSRPYIVP